MQIAKSRVLRFVTERDGDEQAARVGRLLDDPVDTEAQGGLLAQLGISVLELTAAVPDDDATTFGDRPRRPD